MSKAIPVRVPDDLLERVDEWARANGLKRSPAIVALIEAGLDGSAAAPAPRPAPVKGPVPAMILARDAPGKRGAIGAIGAIEPIEKTSRVEVARRALAEAEGKAAHLATPKGGRVDMRAAMESAGVMDYGTRPVVYGSRLKGAKAKASR